MTSDDIKRLYFYEKQFLRTQDFQDEQAYHIEMRRRHNIAHHTWGIIVGLEIMQDPTSKVWSVQPGMAVDGFGREILLVNHERLDTDQIARQLSGTQSPAKLKVWIEYNIEKTNRPLPGYEVCNGKEQFTRTRETFRLIYQDDPPFAVKEHEKPVKWLHPYEDLPDDPQQKPWPVYLGTITWNIDPSDPTKKVIKSVDLTGRRYVGNITSEVLAPAGELLIRDRNSPHPLQPNDKGVTAKLEGSLEVERLLKANQDVHILGKVGIGTTDPPDTKLQVSGGTDAMLDNGTGHVVIGSVSSKNMVLDNHGIMARNNKVKAELQLQSKGGDLVVHKDEAGKEFIIKDSGNVGIGTTIPASKLDVRGPSNAHTAVFSSNPPSANPWPNQLTLMGSDNNSEARLGFGTTFPDGSGHHTAIIKTVVPSNRGGDLVFQTREPGFGNITERMRITNNGNVGIGTATPACKLDLNGDLIVRGNQNIFKIKTYTKAVLNSGINQPGRWEIDYQGHFSEVYDAFVVLQGFSFWNYSDNINFNPDSNYHSESTAAIPQHVFVRLEGKDNNHAWGVSYCSESHADWEVDNTVLFTLVVMGRG